MDIKLYVDQKKHIYEELIQFIDDDSESPANFDNLLNKNCMQKIQDDIEEFRLFIYLLAKISMNHHRNTHFFSKIEKIISEFEEKIKQSFSNKEIFDIFKKNKRILLFLFENKIITINNEIARAIKSISFTKDQNCQNIHDYFDDYAYIEEEEEEESIGIKNKYIYYFYLELKKFLSTAEQNYIEKELNSLIGKDNINYFEEKRKIGENDSYICQLIQQDSVENFIEYTNRNVVSLHSSIPSSIFETNFIFQNKCPTLIEYAAFCGSIQIFQYLLYNNVELEPPIWIYAIHSRNPELIHLLEANKVQPLDQNYEICFKESVKCHHNEIAHYIYNNLMDIEDNHISNFKNNIFLYSFHYHNYSFLPDELSHPFVFLYLCKYNYVNLVKLFLDKKEIDINLKTVL